MARTATWIAVLCLAGLGACGTPEVAEEYEERTLVPTEIEAALSSDDPNRRSEAAAQVEKLEPARRRAVLVQLTKDDRSATRMTAVMLLSNHHADEVSVVDRLIEIVSLDVDPDVRVVAIGALSAGGSKDGLDAILGALSDDISLVVRSYAAETLDRITAQTFGEDLAGKFEEAEIAAEEASMSYGDWLEANRERLVWDADAKRFGAGEEK